MPRDDRDQNFEKALARSLGSSSASPGAAESPADSPANDCLDAETLAAYHERLLDPEEMARRKTHIAGCERCQEVLAQLEATDRIAVEADRDLLFDQMIVEIPELESADAVEERTVSTEVPTEVPAKVPAEVAGDPVAAPAAETVPPEELADATLEPEVEPAIEPEIETESEFILDPQLLHDPELVPTSAPPQSPSAPSLDFVRPATPVAVAAKVAPASATITFHSPREGRPKMVRFVAIAGALAAGLILWFVYRDQTKPAEIAQNRSAELPPQSRGAAPLPSADGKDASATPQTSTPNAASPQSSPSPSTAQPSPSKMPTDNVSNALDDAQKTLDTAKAIEKKSRRDAAAATQSPAFIPSGQDESAPATGALDFARGAIARPGSNEARRKLEAANQPSASTPLRTVNNAAGDSATTIPSGIPSTPPPARTKMNRGVVTEPATANSAAPAPTQLSSSAQSEALTKPINGRSITALTLTPLSVPAPSGTTIWRIGQAGVIQRSTDSGATWSIQPSGVVSDLIAGSAYSDQVCWLVGRNGTVLRTTNGGATWRKLASPSNVDLLAVFSINADSATVTDAAGRAFETTTAGAHWTRTKLQQ